VTPVRIQRKRTAGWRMPPDAVYVGRPTKWGNPFDFQDPAFCWAALSFGCRADPAGRHEASVRAHRAWIDPPFGRQTIRMREQPKLVGKKGAIGLGPPIEAGAAPSKRDIVAELRGKSLACWCRLDQPCHADVLLELANPKGGHTP
jgi:hypothetical protein